MTRHLSLRARLTLIILIPLLLIAAVAGAWRVNQARFTASEVFNRSLLSAALAVSHDVSLSGGDALSPQTREILSDTSGGPVFYHVYAPDGVIVAGYATPPVGIPTNTAEPSGTSYFSATYLGRPVSGVRLQTRTEIEGFSGIFTTTVWQDTSVRAAFVTDLMLRSFIIIASLIACVALVVWFGVRLGLRPLLDLQDAIERRSSDELSPIRRPVPTEVRGIVDTLNRLFLQVSQSMSAQADFISNAAHQLRNPIAGVLSLAEAVDRAPNWVEAKTRSDDLLEAARETADLAQKLLTLERAGSISPVSLHQRIDLADALRGWAHAIRSAAPERIEVALDIAEPLGTLHGDPTMLREAISNLTDNALRHGGPEMTRVQIGAKRTGDEVEIVVEDDGKGIAADKIDMAMERFSQVSATSGSGLGLAIVQTIVKGHGGHIEVAVPDRGLRIAITLPDTPA